MYKKRNNNVFFVFSFLLPFSFGWVNDMASQLATLSAGVGRAYPETVQVQDLIDRYETQKLSVLIVPGHDNEDPGSAFGKVREADINLTMTTYLLERFGNDSHMSASSTRDVETGEYTTEFQTFLDNESDDINSWSNALRALTTYYHQNGLLDKKIIVHHNSAGTRVSQTLYGINRFANEHDVDIVLHVHFNDYSRRSTRAVGTYSGFTIYVPDEQLPNGRASQALAEPILSRLTTHFPVSNLPGESSGITQDQELIAVGSNGSREKVSLLIEYGYIYESQFKSPEVREKILREMAYQTYLGVIDFFEASGASEAEETTLYPFVFTRNLMKGEKNSTEVLHLQGVLHALGFYPPTGKTLSECPINGAFGNCVERSVKTFQTQYGISTTGSVGPLTRIKLNELSETTYSSTASSTVATTTASVQ